MRLLPITEIVRGEMGLRHVVEMHLERFRVHGGRG